MSQHKFISISNETDFYDKKLKGQLEFLSKNGFDVIAVAPTVTDLKTLNTTENLSTISIKIAQGISFFKDCTAFWKLYRLFKRKASNRSYIQLKNSCDRFDGSAFGWGSYKTIHHAGC